MNRWIFTRMNQKRSWALLKNDSVYLFLSTAMVPLKRIDLFKLCNCGERNSFIFFKEAHSNLCLAPSQVDNELKVS